MTISILSLVMFSLLTMPSSFAQNTSETPLISAVLYKGVEELKKSLADGEDINQQDAQGYTALIWACSYSSREVYRESAKLLIAEGADVNIQAKDGNTAIIEAAGNSEEVFNLLLEKDADLKARKTDGTGAYYNGMLHMLLYGREISDQDLARLQLLLSNGADVDEAPQSGELQGYTALIFATRENKPEIVRFLIENGANVNAVNADGDTPLSMAKKAENKQIIEMLKAKGAK